MGQAGTIRQKIGLLGGTFDPVHNGHLALGAHVLQAIGLDDVRFIPAALPPHKTGHTDGLPVTGFVHRLKMLQLAIAGNEFFSVSDIEARRDVPSYSIDTIEILLRQTGNRAELFFIIGADAFLEIDTWKNFRELPNLVSFVVISRASHTAAMVGEAISRLFSGYSADHAGTIWTSPAGGKSFIVSHMEPVPVSSTEIRERLKNGQGISGMVPAAVEDYIIKERLYHN